MHRDATRQLNLLCTVAAAADGLGVTDALNGIICIVESILAYRAYFASCKRCLSTGCGFYST